MNLETPTRFFLKMRTITQTEEKSVWRSAKIWHTGRTGEFYPVRLQIRLAKTVHLWAGLPRSKVCLQTRIRGAHGYVI